MAIPALQQDIASDHTKRTYRIFVSVPSNPAPEQGFPVLYLLDGNATYPLAAQLLKTFSERPAAHGITPGILVGIGYPIESETDPVRRAEDYTPPAPDLTHTGDPSGHPQGGADRFLDFIEKELKPKLARDFKIDSDRQTLFGHSYGGLFTLHTLFTRPDSFQGYYAASPSIWWNQQHILQSRDAFLERKDPAILSREVRLSVGDLEQRSDSAQPSGADAQRKDERRQVDHARDLDAALRTAGVNCGFVIFPNENHGSARIPAVSQAIRFAFANPIQSSPTKR